MEELKRMVSTLSEKVARLEHETTSPSTIPTINNTHQREEEEGYDDSNHKESSSSFQDLPQLPFHTLGEKVTSIHQGIQDLRRILDEKQYVQHRHLPSSVHSILEEEGYVMDQLHLLQEEQEHQFSCLENVQASCVDMEEEQQVFFLILFFFFFSF